MSKRIADEVVAEVERQIDSIDTVMTAFPWEQTEAYAEFLAQTNFYVRRVSQVLAAALARTPVNNRGLHQHFVNALIEEKDHDELAIVDLRELGFSIDQFVEKPLTRAYYQTLFYMIDSAGPVSVMGYFFVLEAWAALRGRRMYERIVNAYGGRAQSFVHEHILLDAEHYPQAVKVLQTLDTSDAEIVKDTVALSGQIYRHMIAALHADVEATRAVA